MQDRKYKRKCNFNIYNVFVNNNLQNFVNKKEKNYYFKNILFFTFQKLGSKSKIPARTKQISNFSFIF